MPRVFHENNSISFRPLCLQRSTPGQGGEIHKTPAFFLVQLQNLSPPPHRNRCKQIQEGIIACNEVLAQPKLPLNTHNEKCSINPRAGCLPSLVWLYIEGMCYAKSQRCCSLDGGEERAVRRKSERFLINTSILLPLESTTCLFFSFLLLLLKAQFIDSSFPLSQPAINRLQGRGVSICLEALRAAGRWRLSLRLLQQRGRVYPAHIPSTKGKLASVSGAAVT